MASIQDIYSKTLLLILLEHSKIQICTLQSCYKRSMFSVIPSAVSYQGQTQPVSAAPAAFVTLQDFQNFQNAMQQELKSIHRAIEVTKIAHNIRSEQKIIENNKPKVYHDMVMRDLNAEYESEMGTVLRTVGGVMAEFRFKV